MKCNLRGMGLTRKQSKPSKAAVQKANDPSFHQARLNAKRGRVPNYTNRVGSMAR